MHSFNYLIWIALLVHQVKLEENEEWCLGAYIGYLILFQLKFILFQVTTFVYGFNFSFC